VPPAGIRPRAAPQPVRRPARLSYHPAGACLTCRLGSFRKSAFFTTEGTGDTENGTEFLTQMTADEGGWRQARGGNATKAVASAGVAQPPPAVKAVYSKESPGSKDVHSRGRLCYIGKRKALRQQRRPQPRAAVPHRQRRSRPFQGILGARETRAPVRTQPLAVRRLPFVSSPHPSSFSLLPSPFFLLPSSFSLLPSALPAFAVPIVRVPCFRAVRVVRRCPRICPSFLSPTRNMELETWNRRFGGWTSGQRAL